MEISRISPANAFAFPLPEKDAVISAAVPSQDRVDISPMNLLRDDEVESVFGSTLGMISQDSVAALSVHGGLNAGRVALLLGL